MVIVSYLDDLRAFEFWSGAKAVADDSDIYPKVIESLKRLL